MIVNTIWVFVIKKDLVLVSYFSQILENFLLNITMNGIELQIYKLHYHIIKINKMLIKLQNIKFSML